MLIFIDICVSYSCGHVTNNLIMYTKRVLLTICFTILFLIQGGYAQDFTEQIVCVETFKNNERPWDVGQFDDYSAEIANGLYRVAGQSKSATVYSGLLLEPKWLEPFLISLNFQFVTHHKKDLFGLVIYDDQHSDDVLFTVRTDGHYSFRVSDEVVMKGKVDLIDDVLQPLFLKMEHKEDTLMISINDELVHFVSYVPFSGRKVGLYLKGNCTVAVDQFTFVQEGIPIPTDNGRLGGFVMTNLGPLVNTRFNEYVSHISVDHKQIYFNSDNYPEIDTLWGFENRDIYIFEKDSTTGWHLNKPVALNNELNNGVITGSSNDQMLFLQGQYTSRGTGNGSGISQTRRGDDGRWIAPEIMPIRHLSNSSDQMSFDLLPDQDVMVFSMENRINVGDLDLFISFYKNNRWTKPVSLETPINSPYDEYDPELSADGQLLYFSSTGHPSYGDADIFVSKRLDETWLNWSVPKNLGSLVNTSSNEDHFTLSENGELALFSSNQNGGYGGYDIYMLSKPDEALVIKEQVSVPILDEDVEVVSEPVLLETPSDELMLTLRGRVSQLSNNAPLNAYVSCWIEGTGTKLAETFSSDVDGDFLMEIPSGNLIVVNAEKDGFLFSSNQINVSNVLNSDDVFVDIKMQMVAPIDAFAFDNITFYFDTDKLHPSSVGKLDEILQFLQKNPELRIEIGGHADSIGTEAYNNAKSLQRAQGIAQYFIDRGIEKNRLLVVGYGEKYPIESNMFNDGRSKNRRIEFKIIDVD